MEKRSKLGPGIGFAREATILKFNSDGTIRIGLLESNLGSGAVEFNIPIPAAWTGPNGEFLGGCPAKGQSLMVSQGHSGKWHVINYIKSDKVFATPYGSNESTKMSALRPGRALMQVKDGTRLFADPNIGIQAGNAQNFVHINPIKNITSHNFNSEFSFTEGSRHINQPIKRDLSDNLNRNTLGSTLTSQIYDDSLFTIGMDPLVSIGHRTVGNIVRNLPLVEDHEIIYEFSNSYEFSTDSDESARYDDPLSEIKTPQVNRHEMRSDAFSLSLEYPNHLIETVKGTAVDIFGNILDLNRAILPIGKTDNLSLRKNQSKSDAFNLIRGQHRKAIAYHFELNARKGGIDSIPAFPEASPDVTKTNNYARDRSRFFIDIDKEGQFKINVPASSEVGNVPLLTRYENFSVVEAKSGEIHPNEFVRNNEKQDILLEDFAGKSSIKLAVGNDDLKGYASPIDRNTGEPIKYGTAFHDISQTCITFTENSPFIKAEGKFISYYPGHHLNTSFTPVEKIVSDTIITSGPEANAGGRSGALSFDGFVSLNIGANTIDRQSMWVDMAGGVVSNIGRDLRNISYAGKFDGDVLMEIGGAGIGNTYDDRFADINDSMTYGNLQIHVLGPGGLMVFKMGTNKNNSAGVDISSPGNITISCQQDMYLRAGGSMKFDANTYMFDAQFAKRMILKLPGKSI